MNLTASLPNLRMHCENLEEKSKRLRKWLLILIAISFKVTMGCVVMDVIGNTYYRSLGGGAVVAAYSSVLIAFFAIGFFGVKNSKPCLMSIFSGVLTVLLLPNLSILFDSYGRYGCSGVIRCMERTFTMEKGVFFSAGLVNGLTITQLYFLRQMDKLAPAMPLKA